MKKFPLFFKQLTLLSLLSLLAGCGFHLRGNRLENFPHQVVFVDRNGHSDSFANQLSKALRQNQIHMTDNLNEAQWILTLKNCTQNHSLSQMTGGALAGRYLVERSCWVSLSTVDHTPLVKPVHLHSQRTFSSNATLQLSLNTQINQAQQVVTQQLINQILTMLISQNKAPAKAHSP